MDVKKSIRILRIVALLLFITPSIGLLGSLIIHNYLVSFNFTHQPDYKFTKITPGISNKILCSEENGYCENHDYGTVKSLDKCIKYEVSTYDVTESGKLIDIERKDIKNYKEKIFKKYEITNKINKNCILNTNSMYFYNIFPFYYEAVYKIKTSDNTSLGTSKKVNPLFYGETSISNIVKRFPIKFFFKPILFLGVIFMFFYWIYYNKILQNLSDSKNNYYFFKFGILSAIFLFLHVLFLGSIFESEILTKLRRSLIVFFILFEVLAQTFLLRKIFIIKDKITEYINLVVVYTKLIFILLVLFLTAIILVILIFYSLDAKIDYIIEWNYFLLLLLFYFLSYLMWKRKI